MSTALRMVQDAPPKPLTVTARRDAILKVLIAKRHKLAWSQVQLARETGFHVNSISKWERGFALPNLGHLLVWCGVLGVETLDLSGRELVIRPRRGE